MKPESRKLSLKRETLMQMNDEELVNVNGGTLSAATRAVSRASIAFSKWSSKECASGAIYDSVVRSVVASLDRVRSGGEKK
jgi:hypothetical protein